MISSEWLAYYERQLFKVLAVLCSEVATSDADDLLPVLELMLSHPSNTGSRFSFLAVVRGKAYFFEAVEIVFSSDHAHFCWQYY